MEVGYVRESNRHLQKPEASRVKPFSLWRVHVVIMEEEEQGHE